MKIRNALLMSALLLTQGAWAQTVKVGTFNVKLSSNGDWIADANTPNAWPERKDGFVQVFRSLDVDVWGLQEVCPDQTAYFEKHLPEWEFVGDYRMADRKSGEASSVAFKKDRFEVIEKGTFWLSETPDVPGSMSWNTAHPRVCSYAFLKDRRTGVKFCFANTHLDHKSGEARKRAGVQVIYSPAGVDADAVIEKIVTKARAQGADVLVVTSDEATQWTVLGDQVTRMSAAAFAQEVEVVNASWQERNPAPVMKTTLGERVSGDVAAKLARMARGEDL